ncbi:hypothetical protein E4U40_005589 [Claviceps sp. LM458 group G5]|nr:hypothetical protein E4U40_005589 [Claviceps sp. LM458 group G5]
MASANPLLAQLHIPRLCCSRSWAWPLASTALPHTGSSSARWSSSGARWKERQAKDPFTKEAKRMGFKARASLKLVQMNAKFKLFKPGQTVIDLVAYQRTRPRGRVIGIDILPSTPPLGVATFQGDFLSPRVRKLVKEFIARAKVHDKEFPQKDEAAVGSSVSQESVLAQRSYFDQEKHASEDIEGASDDNAATASVDVVLSDMSAPLRRSSGFAVSKTLTNPYRRLMNTSGSRFRDHAGSMDLCTAALQFASETLKPGGHFVCKFYQGAEDKEFENQLRKMFDRVCREKPEASRAESNEAYFVALRRKRGAQLKLEEE